MKRAEVTNHNTSSENSLESSVDSRIEAALRDFDGPHVIGNPGRQGKTLGRQGAAAFQVLWPNHEHESESQYAWELDIGDFV
jgi:hypothetical protein